VFAAMTRSAALNSAMALSWLEVTEGVVACAECPRRPPLNLR
jgi:hypothetical protein